MEQGDTAFFAGSKPHIFMPVDNDGAEVLTLFVEKMRKGGKEIMIYDLLLLGISLLFVGFIFKKILPGRGVGQMETEELHKEMKENKDNLQLIDVRQPEKYAQYHIHGFRNIPLKYIRKQAKELDPEKKTIVVCRTGQ